MCVCVLVFGGTRATENTCDGEHVRTENTCRRRTRADGEHERRQRPAVGQREKGSRDSLFFSLFIWGLCVSVVEALSGNLVLFKFSDCRVIRVFLFPCFVYCACKFTAFYLCVIKCAFLMCPFHRLFLY